MDKIRVQTKAGNIVEMNAVVTDWIGSDGKQYSTARVGRSVYRVTNRDSFGAIFGR